MYVGMPFFPVKVFCVSQGLRRNLWLFFAGALTVLTFAPFSFWALLCLTLPFFFCHLDAATSTRRAMFDGFWFGYGFFMAGTYWIAISMTVDLARFAWMIPFSVLGLSAVLALSFLLIGYLYHRFKTKNLTINLLFFTALWVSVEWLRSQGELGFAWNLIGYSLTEVLPLMQLASVAGVYGLSLLAVMMGLCVVPCLYTTRLSGGAVFSIITLAVVIITYGYGIYYLKQPVLLPVNNYNQQNPESQNKAKGGIVNPRPLRLRIVQANIAQSMKWDHTQAVEIMRIHKSLSQLVTDAPPADIVLWSESAIPSLLTSGSEWGTYISDFLPPAASLISGVVRADPEGRYYNSLAVFNHDGAVLATYDKRHLVPFGEYMPLRNILPLDALAASEQDFSRGLSHQVMRMKFIPSFIPIICYESIFPWLASAQNGGDGIRPKWLLLLTNDAWFGNSIGPYQHFSFAKIRAVEQGLPLVRVANTGISGVIDAHGKVVRKLGLEERGIIDTVLPNALPPTFYSYWNEASFLMIVLTIYLLVWRYSNTT